MGFARWPNWLNPLRSRLASVLTRWARAWESRHRSRSVWIYRLAIALDSRVSARHCALANLYTDLNQWERAIASYRRATDCDRGNSEAWLKLARLLDRQHGAAAAIDSYLEAVRCDPTRQWCYDYKLWEIAEATESLSRCAGYFQDLLDRDGETMRYRARADLQLNLGEALTRSGRIAEATEVFRTATTDRLIQRDRRFLGELWNPDGDRHPDFIIIGAPKCGTTSLFYYLLQHPNILPSLRKEICFWSDALHHGLDWYLSQLPPHPQDGRWLSGESSPAYFFTPDVPELMAPRLPNVKLVALLRNPVDRVISQFHHRKRQTIEALSLDAFVDTLLNDFARAADLQTPDSTPSALNKGFYAHHLRRWLHHFDRDRLLVLQSETFFREPDRILQTVHEFLGLPHVPLDDYRAYNAGTYPEAEASVRDKLAEFFAPYNAELEALLDRRFDW